MNKIPNSNQRPVGQRKGEYSMLSDNVLYCLDGKKYWMTGDDWNQTVEEKGLTKLIAWIPEKKSVDATDEDLEYFKKYYQGIFKQDDGVFFLNTNPKGWKIKEIITQHTNYLLTTYYLVDPLSEMRVLDSPSEMEFVGDQETLKYIFQVINNYESWEDYDEKGDKLSPSEEAKMEREELDKKNAIKADWLKEFDERCNEIRSDIQFIVNVNADGGPGSRKRAEKMLLDLDGRIYDATWLRHKQYMSL